MLLKNKPIHLKTLMNGSSTIGKSLMNMNKDMTLDGKGDDASMDTRTWKINMTSVDMDKGHMNGSMLEKSPTWTR